MGYEDDIERELDKVMALPVTPEEIAAAQASVRVLEAFKKVVLESPPDELTDRYLNDPFFHAAVTVLERTWMLRAEARLTSSPIEHCMALAHALAPFVRAETLKKAAADLRKLEHALGPLTTEAVAEWLERLAVQPEGK